VSSKTPPKIDRNQIPKIEEEVHMTTDIVRVYWSSDHAFTAGASVSQSHVKPALAWQLGV
jgi:hypothetical protein